MPTREDLVGLGMAPEMASVLGNSPQLVTCTGTQQSTAAPIYTHNVELNAQSSQTGAILPSAAKIGTPYYIQNGTASATSGVVYVPVGHTLNGTLNNGFTIAQNKQGYLIQYKKNFWGSNLTA
jgi:hypothetical protein